MSSSLAPRDSPPPLQIEGRFFSLHGTRTFLKSVTLGPFPPDCPPATRSQLRAIKAAGFHSIRTYDLPSESFLNLLHSEGLVILVTFPWNYHQDFRHHPAHLSQARTKLSEFLKAHGHHPALAAVFVANEIPTDLVRWMGPVFVRETLEDLIDLCHTLCPHLLAAYSNYPSTEYLEPANADFTAFNIYLEDVSRLSAYLPRLHNLAGDRPLFISESGLDTIRHSEAEQAMLLKGQMTASLKAGCAGFTVFAWSDLWFNNEQVVNDWAFGITRADGSPKAAVAELQDVPNQVPLPSHPPKISILICTRNGTSTLREALSASVSQTYPNFEVILVDDGSTQDIACIAAEFPNVRYHRQEPAGLSVARNTAAQLATGDILSYTDDDCLPDCDWLLWLSRFFLETNYAAVGGPNLPPPPTTCSQALAIASPGAATHVLIDDFQAEHLPGCNLSVRRDAFDSIRGFDPLFQTAGDDVDFCWRLQEAGLTLGFCAAAFVWHHRRPTLRGYLNQKIGYGKAEALLYSKHPHRFTDQGIKWNGAIYNGATIRVEPGLSIYHGPLNQAAYQFLTTNPLPNPPLPSPFNTSVTCCLLKLLTAIHPVIRGLARWRHGGPRPKFYLTRKPPVQKAEGQTVIVKAWSSTDFDRLKLLQHFQSQGWQISPDERIDLVQGHSSLLLASEPHSSACLHLIKIQSSPPNQHDFYKICQKILLGLPAEMTLAD